MARVCIECGELKPEVKYKLRKNGRSSRCRGCTDTNIYVNKSCHWCTRSFKVVSGKGYNRKFCAYCLNVPRGWYPLTYASKIMGVNRSTIKTWLQKNLIKGRYCRDANGWIVPRHTMEKMADIIPHGEVIRLTGVDRTTLWRLRDAMPNSNYFNIGSNTYYKRESIQWINDIISSPHRYNVSVAVNGSKRDLKTMLSDDWITINEAADIICFSREWTYTMFVKKNGVKNKKKVGGVWMLSKEEVESYDL